MDAATDKTSGTANNSQRLDMWRRTARGVGAVALIFSLVVGVLLTTDGLQSGQAKTVRSEVLTQVLTTARQSSGDAMAVALAREDDVIARHAYFSSVVFRNTGTWMLVSGLLVMVACLQIAARLGRQIEDPRRFPAVDQARADRDARLSLLVAGVACMLGLPVWVHNSLSSAASGLPMHTSAPAGDIKPAATTPSGTVAVVVDVAGTAKVTRADVGARQWNCFRGPACGVVFGSNAPTAWDGKTGSGILWHVALAKPGVGSPVLWGGRVFLTLADEKTRDVLAYDATSGKELWRQEVKDGGKSSGAALPEITADTGLDAATSVCDDSGVYAIFGTGDLVAFSPDGKLLWQVYLGRPEKNYGFSSSLVAQDGRLFIQYDQAENGRVLAVDQHSGKTIWEKKRTQGPAWCSPVIVPGADGKPVLLINGVGVLSAYDLVLGTELWNVEGVSGEIAPSPAYWNGRVMIAMASARMVCYELAVKPLQKWEYSETLPDVASPVAAGGLVFVPGGSEIACVDATNGASVWKHDYSAGFYASLAVCGNRLYALDREGVMHVLAAERKFQELATCSLGEGEAADATPAFGDGRIFIRTKKTLWCVGEK